MDFCHVLLPIHPRGLGVFLGCCQIVQHFPKTIFSRGNSWIAHSLSEVRCFYRTTGNSGCSPGFRRICGVATFGTVFRMKVCLERVGSGGGRIFPQQFSTLGAFFSVTRAAGNFLLVTGFEAAPSRYLELLEIWKNCENQQSYKEQSGKSEHFK